MATITKGYDFGSNDCIGCGKKLTKRNKKLYHNRKCLNKYYLKLGKFLGRIILEPNK